jgi:Domain of unknown function (DUF4272)
MFDWLGKKDTAPDASAVIGRVIILKNVFVKGLATPPPEYLADCKARWSTDDWNRYLEMARNQNVQRIERLRQSGLWNAMDVGERKFMQAGPAEFTQRDGIDASWRTESIVCLLWALGYISEVPPFDVQVNPELTNKLPTEPLEVLVKKATLRPRESIEKQRDLAELWHWRSRTRQLQESGYNFKFPDGMTIEKVLRVTSAEAATNGDIPNPIGDDFPAFGKAYRDLTNDEYSQATSIAVERHHAFNWLCGLAPGNRWAETPTDT